MPRKAVNEVQKLIEDPGAEVRVEISATKARFTFGDPSASSGQVVLISKLIDGTFPDYVRVIPSNNDKRLVVDRAPFAAAVDRVSTISSERGRAVKLALADSKLTFSVTNPDFGSAMRNSTSIMIPHQSTSASMPATSLILPSSSIATPCCSSSPTQVHQPSCKTAMALAPFMC